MSFPFFENFAPPLTQSQLRQCNCKVYDDKIINWYSYRFIRDSSFFVSYTGYYVKTSNCPTQKKVTESTEVTILWDFTISADRKIEASRPEITKKNQR